MAGTFDAESHLEEAQKRTSEVALEDLMMEQEEREFMAALPEVAKQLKIANLLNVVQLLGPNSKRSRNEYLDQALELLEGS